MSILSTLVDMLNRQANDVNHYMERDSEKSDRELYDSYRNPSTTLNRRLADAKLLQQRGYGKQDDD